MTDIKILTSFKKNLVDFFDELIQQFPRDSELIIIRTFIQHQAIIDLLMKKFIASINKSVTIDNQQVLVRTLITTRDENLFINHNLFFFCDKTQDDNTPESRTINKDNANHFKTLWLSGRLDKDDKDVVWNWLNSFVDLADKFTKTVNIKNSKTAK